VFDPRGGVHPARFIGHSAKLPNHLAKILQKEYFHIHSKHCSTMGCVRNILEGKGHEVVSVPPTVTAFKALEVMRDMNVGGLLITEGDSLVGIFTERDYARKVILKGKSSREMQVSELMTPDPITVKPETSIEDCMGLMTNKFIRHLPVLDAGKIVGVVSIGDVVRFIIDEQRYLIEHLEHYITGR
jgi:CBS domain-containing protein